MVENEKALDASNAVLADRSEGLRPALARYFVRRGCALHETEDLIQEVFLRLVRRGNIQSLENLDGYIFQVAATVFTDRFRHRQSRGLDRQETFEPELHGGTSPGAEEGLLGREALSAVSAILLELPERTRQVFVLRRLEQVSFHEIAKRLGLSVSAAEKHMLRAARALRTRLGDA